jgi:hypothetical protein
MKEGPGPIAVRHDLPEARSTVSWLRRSENANDCLTWAESGSIFSSLSGHANAALNGYGENMDVLVNLHAATIHRIVTR